MIKKKLFQTDASQKVCPSRVLKGLATVMLISLAWQRAGAAPDHEGLHFGHKDWELVCDNTRTCRAAGYQSDADAAAVSLLLTREAGPDTPISAMMQIGSYLDEEEAAAVTEISELTMFVNGKPHGTVRVVDAIGELTQAQISVLLSVLTRTSTIEWRTGEQRWELSDRGATAVLLKMDEFQGRIDTPGALVKKGSRDEGAVLPPLPLPVRDAAPLSKPRPQDKRFEDEHADVLLAALRDTVAHADCPELFESSAKPMVSRLSDSVFLISASCEMFVYNYRLGFWLMPDRRPYRPVLLPFEGTDYGQGVIRASNKGRGLGDCWSKDEWTWDGVTFVHTHSSSTGMCKLVAPGGAWQLPTLVTEVRSRYPSRAEKAQ